GSTASLKIEEKKRVVFVSRPAETSAKLIAGQLWPGNTFAGIQLNCPVVEKGVRRGQRGTIVFAKGTMKYLSPAFGYHLNLTAAAATFGGGGIGGNGSEFLNRINGGVADCDRKLSRGLIIGVNS